MYHNSIKHTTNTNENAHKMLLAATMPEYDENYIYIGKGLTSKGSRYNYLQLQFAHWSTGD